MTEASLSSHAIRIMPGGLRTALAGIPTCLQSEIAAMLLRDNSVDANACRISLLQDLHWWHLVAADESCTCKARIENSMLNHLAVVWHRQGTPVKSPTRPIAQQDQATGLPLQPSPSKAASPKLPTASALASPQLPAALTSLITHHLDGPAAAPQLATSPGRAAPPPLLHAVAPQLHAAAPRSAATSPQFPALVLSGVVPETPALPWTANALAKSARNSSDQAMLRSPERQPGSTDAGVMTAGLCVCAQSFEPSK